MKRSERSEMEDKLEMFLIELLEKERFEFLEPYMDAGEGCPANTLVGNPVGEILDFLEKQGMTPPYNENTTNLVCKLLGEIIEV